MGLAYLGKRGSKEILPSFPRNVGKPLDALFLPRLSFRYIRYDTRFLLWRERRVASIPSIEGGRENNDTWINLDDDAE